MEKGDLVPPGTRPRTLVDELEAVLLEVGKCFWQVWDPVRDVMEPGTLAVQKTAHGGFGAKGLQDFYGAYEGNSDALAFQDLHRGTGIPGHELELTTGLFQRGYGHGDVVQRVGKHIYIVAWIGLQRGSWRRLNPAAWYPWLPLRTRSSFDG